MRYEEYLKRPAWRARRFRHLKWAKYRCALCGEQGADTVHHLTYEHRGNERHCELLALHHRCHQELHQWFKPLCKGWNSVGTATETRHPGNLPVETPRGPALSSQLTGSESDFGVW